MHFVQRGHSELALAVARGRVYAKREHYTAFWSTDMTFLTTLAKRIATAIRQEPVPCWTEYLRNTRPNS